MFWGLETENLMVNRQFSTNWYLRCSVSRSWSHVFYIYLDVIFHTDSENEFKIEKENAQSAHFWQKPDFLRVFCQYLLDLDIREASDFDLDIKFGIRDINYV